MERVFGFALLVVGLLCGSGCRQSGGPEAAAPCKEQVPPVLLSLKDARLDQSECPALDVAASYPEIAKLKRVQGVVIVRAVVEPDGTLSHVTLLKSVPELDDAVVASVALSHVKPFTAGGHPVRVTCNYPFRFRLEVGSGRGLTPHALLDSARTFVRPRPASAVPADATEPPGGISAWW